MKPISDSFFEQFYFFIGNSPDSHHYVQNEHSWEDLSSTIVRESAADPSKWLRFFNQIIEHPDIQDELAAPVFDGMVAHLNPRSGRIPAPRGFRQPPSVPSKDRLARFILESLERHSVFLEKGFLKLASRPLSMPCLLERLPSSLPDRMTDFIDITVEIAYKFIIHLNGSNRTYDLFWLYRWIEELSRKSPAMADQIRNDLLAAIRRSDRSARIWQADAYAGCLDEMPEENREYRKQGR